MNFLIKDLKLSIKNNFFFEFNLLILPILFTLIFNQYFFELLLFLSSIVILLNFVHYLLNNEWLLSLANINTKQHYEIINNSVHFHFVSKYRSLLQIATCITILAVDFRCFPRKFCKVEEQGVSLMDFGTGSALFSLALVSRQLREKNHNIFKRLFRAISSCLPLFFIGLIRMLMIKQTDYQVKYLFKKNIFFKILKESCF